MENARLRWNIWASLLLLALVWVSGCTATQDLQYSVSEQATDEVAGAVASALAEWLPHRLTPSKVPGAAAAVVGRHAIIWEQMFGVTGAPGSSAITPDTVFCVRSISKSVTALAVLIAVQDGLLDLDSPISEYLPEFTVRSRFDQHPEELITLRHMLSHWAGFTHDPPLGIDLTQSDYFDLYIKRIFNTWLRFPVGYRHQYSNYGFDLAGYLIQVRSGQSFADYVRDKIFEPVGMHRSTFDLEIAEQTEDRALGHNTKGLVVPLPFPEVPAAGLYSSVRDMTRYVQFHLNGGLVNGRRLLREDLMEQYHSIQFGGRGQRSGYCLGLVREAVGNTFSLYHEGGGHGFGSHMIVYPELGFGALIMTNREYHGLTGLQGHNIMNGPVINRNGPPPITEFGTEAAGKLDINDPRLKTVLGRYGDSPGIVVRFENGVLGIRKSADEFLPMTFSDDEGQLVGKYGETAEARFLPPCGTRPGAMMVVNRVYDDNNFRYYDFNDSPMDPFGPDKPNWQSYLGKYDVLWASEPFATAEVSIKNGHLYYRDGKCEEYEPGLFFRYDGETLDFRSSPPSFANLELRRKQR